jgi:hypothetical protein
MSFVGNLSTRKAMRILAVTVFLLLLAGCEDLFAPNARDMCLEQPQFCADLNPDGWCQAEKSQVIKNRYADLKNPQEITDYRLLIAFEKYKVCVSKAAQIVHIKQPEKQAERMKAVVVAEKELKRLTRKTRQSKEPHLQYYHWSRFNDQAALKNFLLYRDQNKLDTPDLQLGLAAYYVKFDLDKAIKALFHALELYQEHDDIDNEIFKSLSTIYLKLEDYQKAYIWALVAIEFSVKDVDLRVIEPLLTRSNSIKKLENLADDIVDSIEDREFVLPIELSQL